MLHRITIQNYALIEALEIDFGKGLNIITGETGAGKSILLGALSLLLGDRADKNVLLDKNRKCVVEASFQVESPGVYGYLKLNDLDVDKQILLRREINLEGKSRSFINDTPVTLSQLKDLGALIVEIHSQHETYFLKQKKYQQSVVDAFAGTEEELELYRQDYSGFKNLLKHLGMLEVEEKKSRADMDYYQFLFNELDEAALNEGEQELLENELHAFTHAEEIKQNLDSITSGLSGSEDNINSRVSRMLLLLQGAAKHQHSLSGLGERMKSVSIELKDISSEIEQIAGEILSDPGRTEEIQKRLNEIYRLEQKHRVKSIEDLIRLRKEIEEKLKSISSLAEEIEKCKAGSDILKRKIIDSAHKISARRNQAIPVVEKEISSLLEAVNLPHAVLKVENEIQPDENFTLDGIDSMRFLFSANKGIPLREVDKVASGGELSRLMLCIKAAVGRLIRLPVMIFDEIDTGISGETAMKVGNVLKQLSAHHQLIAITHLPQIASRGENHYFVFKETAKNKTAAKVKLLSKDERIVQIAKMLSGDKPGTNAMKNAKDLLRN